MEINEINAIENFVLRLRLEFNKQLGEEEELNLTQVGLYFEKAISTSLVKTLTGKGL